MGILEYHAQGTAEVSFLNLIDIDAVIADLSVCDIVEPVDQVGNGGLAGSRGPYKGDLLARLREKRDIVQDDLVLIVAEIHIVHDHTPPSSF